MSTVQLFRKYVRSVIAESYDVDSNYDSYDTSSEKQWWNPATERDLWVHVDDGDLGIKFRNGSYTVVYHNGGVWQSLGTWAHDNFTDAAEEAYEIEISTN